jgi:hypothetical protein
LRQERGEFKHDALSAAECPRELVDDEEDVWEAIALDLVRI